MDVKEIGCIWTEFIWHRIGSLGVTLCRRYCTLRFHRSWGFPWLVGSDRSTPTWSRYVLSVGGNINGNWSQQKISALSYVYKTDRDSCEQEQSYIGVNIIFFRNQIWKFSSPPRPDRLWGPLSLLSNGYQGPFSPRVKRQGREADHSPPSSAEVKNAWSYTSTQYAFMALCSVKNTGTTLSLPNLEVANSTGEPGLDDRGLISGRGNECFFSLGHCFQTGSGSHPLLCPVSTRGLSLGPKRPGREVDHSPSSSVVPRLRTRRASPIRLEGAILR
jgi:hypothetical protein